MKKTFLLAIGIVFLIKAIFDKQIGVDEGWGRGKVFVLTIGLVCIFAALFSLLFQNKYFEIKKQLSAFINDHFNKSVQIIFISLITTIFVISIYIWFAQPSARNVHDSYNYYSEQALAFKAGNLHLMTKPSKDLLSLTNPYDYILRKQANIEDFPWDVSLYKEKFYMYWGPVPSLFLTILNKETLFHIDDNKIALAFASGLFLYAMLIISTCWNRQLQSIPIWVPIICLLAVGFATPISIMLKDSRIYEASIFGCQFFFIGGCFWVYSALNNDRPVLWKLALGAIHWALAAGTRATIIPVISFTAFTTLIYIYKTFKPVTLKLYWPIAVALILPLMLAAYGLGWYNWARFGSIFEFGIKYQLTNVDYNIFTISFSESYIQGNLYNYFVHPFKLSTRFPYITRIEYLPSNDRMAGLIYLSPYILLLAAPLLRIFNRLGRTNSNFPKQQEKEDSGDWLITIFAGSTTIAMLLILSFYFVTMRYIADFMPSLLLLTTIQLGREFRQSNRTNISWGILSGITITLAVLTITSNVLVVTPQSGMEFMYNLINSMSKLAGLK